MTNYILCHRTSFPSARLLRDSLISLSGNKTGNIWVTDNSLKLGGKKKLIIRYGNSTYVNGEDTKYNSPELINLASNKWTFSDFLQKTQKGFYVPIFSRILDNVTFPALLRTTLSSYGGKGISVVKNEEELKTHWTHNSVWTPYIKTRFELRVHILGGKIKRIFKKMYSGENEEEYPIRNMDKGYHFSLRTNFNAYKKLVPLVEKLQEALDQKTINGANFYSLDVGWSSEKKDYFIYEINSGSGLNPQTSATYALFLLEKIWGMEVNNNDFYRTGTNTERIMENSRLGDDRGEEL